MERVVFSLIATLLFLTAVACVVAGVLSGGVWVANQAAAILSALFITTMFGVLWYTIYHFIYYEG